MIDHEQILHFTKWNAPMFKTPFTDLFIQVRNLQCLEQCGHYELLFADCLEAYGYHKGKEKCRIIFNDMHECVMKVKRLRRVSDMYEERARQFKNGQREKKFTQDVPLDLY